MHLRRHSGVPLYRQLESDLLERMDSGELGPGDRLPPETELARRWGVNRLTVRQAIGELARAGRVTVRRGSGTFVAHRPLLIEIDLPPLPMTEAERTSSAAFAAQDHDPFTEVVLAVTDDEGRVEELGPDPLIRIESVHVTDEGRIPVILSRYWVPAHLFPDLATSLEPGGPVYAALRQDHMTRLRYGWRSLSAVAATADEADLLDVPPGSPLILREGVNVDEAGIPVVFLSRRMRGDRFKYVLRYDTG
jgi:DNA-binding GntR family transcriptional regulator